jgi:UDP-N-acetylmuramoylalanine--D-glutamate ligase
MVLPLIRETPVLAGRRVTVMGLGLFGGGLGVARHLVKAGARVTVTDAKSEHELRESVAELKGLPVTLRLGGHLEEDFRKADLVVVNPAVPESNPYLKLARALETEMNLFFKLLKGRGFVVGITGSNGKTTTTTLVGEIVKKRPGRSWVGGNIGRSLLENVDEIGDDDVVVLELSSFQLENLGALGISPRVGAVLNVTPNHLDRHGTMEAYTAAKRQIVEHQQGGDSKVLNADDAVSRGFASASRSGNWFFSLREKQERGAWVSGEVIDLGRQGSVDVSRRRIRGDFNLANMAAAALCAMQAAAGWPGWRAACEEVFNAFPGVEHRLEFVAEKKGVKYFNDSKATDPEATVAALSTLEGPFVLILGGFDKKTPYDLLAREVAARPVRACVLLGQTAPAIEAALRAQPRVPEILKATSIQDAARVAAKPGETVLLSPACASWDMFRNYVERGRAFKDAVGTL